MKELDFNERSRPSVSFDLDNRKRTAPPKRATRRNYKYREIEEHLEEKRLQRELENFCFE